MKRLFSLFFCLLFGIVLPCQSQDETFSRILLDVNAGTSIFRNSFTREWNPGPDIQAGARTPFYDGNLDMGVRYIRFTRSNEGDDGSDFNSFFFHLGWEYPLHLAPSFFVSPLVRFGSHFMLFDEAKIYGEPPGEHRFDPKENEFFYELGLRNSYKIGEKWHLNLTLSYNRTLTYKPLPLTLVSIGITRTFRMPSGLKSILQ